MSSTSKDARDNRANQLNPIHPAYRQARGVPADQAPEIAQCEQSKFTSGIEPTNAPTETGVMIHNNSTSRKPA